MRSYCPSGVTAASKGLSPHHPHVANLLEEDHGGRMKMELGLPGRGDKILVKLWSALPSPFDSLVKLQIGLQHKDKSDGSLNMAGVQHDILFQPRPEGHHYLNKAQLINASPAELIMSVLQ